MELFLTELEPGDINLARPLSRPTEECIFVLQGKLVVRLDDRDYTLNKGDSIYFEGARLRELRSVGEEKVIFLSAITPPASWLTLRFSISLSLAHKPSGLEQAAPPPNLQPQSLRILCVSAVGTWFFRPSSSPSRHPPRWPDR